MAAKTKVQRTARLIHQDAIRLNGTFEQCTSAVADRLREKSKVVKTFGDFLPNRCALRLFSTIASTSFARLVVEANPIGHIFVDGFRERIGALKHHADAFRSATRSALVGDDKVAFGDPLVRQIE